VLAPPLTTTIYLYDLNLGDEFDGSYSHDEVESDFETLRRKAGVKSCTSSWVKRNYAFGDKEIPTGESECMKVIYGFDRKSGPSVVNTALDAS
jgi:hypothetical protein